MHITDKKLFRTQGYINGQWVDSLGSETIEVINPSDESVIGSISAGTKEDIDLAVAAAKNAFQGGSSGARSATSAPPNPASQQDDT